jgi:hypothetical protein
MPHAACASLGTRLGGRRRAKGFEFMRFPFSNVRSTLG